MIVNIILKDNTTIQLRVEDCNWPSKLHLNSSCVFLKVGDTDWVPTDYKSLHKARAALDVCDTVEDLKVMNLVSIYDN